MFGSQFGLYMSMASFFEKAEPTEIAEFKIQLVNYLLASLERVDANSDFR